jgi:hypothetical protein
LSRTHNPKKKLSILRLKGPGGGTVAVRDTFRLYVFALAEKLYPKRFAKLKERALPLYKAAIEKPPVIGYVDTAAIRARLSKFPAPWPPGETRARTSSPPAVERLKASIEQAEPTTALERVVAEWCVGLGLVESAEAKRTLWLRDLAHNRVRAWAEGDEPMANLITGGVPPMVAPQQLNETPERFKKRLSKARETWPKRAVAEWNRIFRHPVHFEWFVHKRVGAMPLKQMPPPPYPSEQAASQAIKIVAAIVDPD